MTEESLLDALERHDAARIADAVAAGPIATSLVRGKSALEWLLEF